MDKTVVIRHLYRTLFPVFFFLATTSVFAQTEINGTVRDAQTGMSVQTFMLTADSSAHPFSSGEFTLKIGRLPASVRITSEGYLPVNLKIAHTSTNISVLMIPENVKVQEVVVKAFQAGKKLQDVPGSIGLITGKQLSSEPSFTLAPTVNQTAGVWMQSGTMNTNRLTIRGIGSRSAYGSNKIRAYYGDIPLTNGVGETTLEDLDLDQVSQIEIIKGPSSGFYGSGLGGLLLLSPFEPAQNQVRQQVSAGSFGTVKSTTALSLAGENLGNSLVYSYSQSDGYRQNNESGKHNLTWTSAFRKDRTRLDLLAAFIKTNAYIPSSIDLKTFQETPEKAAANWAATRGYEDYTNAFAGISLSQDMQNLWLAKLTVFGHYNRNNELRPFNILQEKNHYQGFRATVEKKLKTEKVNARLVVGDEFFAENYRWQTLANDNRTAGDLLSDNQELRRYINLFLLAEFNFGERLSLSACANYNQIAYEYNDHFLSDGDQSGNHNFDPIISPRIAANWKVKKRVNLYAVVSHGFSPPTLEETLMPDGQRNPSIKPETGWNYELGSKAMIGKLIYFEFSAYYMRVKNLLVARRTGEDAYMGINAGKTNLPGIEISGNYQFLNRRQWTATLIRNLSLNRYRFANFTDNGNDYSGNKLTGAPSAVTNWALEARHKVGLYARLHLQTVGKMPILDDNSLYADAWQLVNFVAGYEKTFKRISVNISSGVQNIFDTRYASMILINATAPPNQSPRYYYPGLPRNYKTTFGLKYSF